MVAVRILLSLGLVAAGYHALARLIGIEVFVSIPGIQGVTEAIRWDPNNPEFYSQLGLLHRDLSQDLSRSVSSFEKAAHLNPYNWEYRFELARTYEFAGLQTEAEEAYLHALRLNPNSGAYHWRAANFYLRAGDLPRCLFHLRTSMDLDPSFRKPSFALLRKLNVPLEQIEQVWPQQVDSQLLLLELLIGAHDQGPESSFPARLWDKIVKRYPSIGISEGTVYVRHLIATSRFAEARSQWIRLAQADGIEDEDYYNGVNLVWNSSFEHPLGAAGWGWRTRPSRGYQIKQIKGEAAHGSQSLQVTFDGTENPDFRGLEQLVPVSAGTYQFSVAARSEGITTDEGVFFRISDARAGRSLLEMGPLRGSTPWQSYSRVFEIPEKVNLARLALERERSWRIDGRLQGRLWVDSVELTLIPVELSETLSNRR